MSAQIAPLAGVWNKIDYGPILWLLYCGRETLFSKEKDLVGQFLLRFLP